MLTTEGRGSGGLEVIAAYQAKLSLPRGQALIRLGQYGNGAIVADLLEAGIPWLMRGKDYGLASAGTGQTAARLACLCIPKVGSAGTCLIVENCR